MSDDTNTQQVQDNQVSSPSGDSPSSQQTPIDSTIVGQFAGVVFNGDVRASMLAGYAGSDFLESMYKLSLARFFK
jgi:hypothetical protein